MNKFLSGCGVVFLILILIASVILNIILFALLAGKNSDYSSTKTALFEEEFITGKSNNIHNTIAVIDLTGIITSDLEGAVEPTALDDYIAQLRQAREDKNVKAIILRINSPGGEVTASDTLYHHIKQTRDAKPVVAYLDSIAASGAYYAAVGATQIIAHELSVTGSIGVILQSLTIRELFDKIGIRALTIKSGKMKDLLNPFRDPQPEEEAFLQAMINETYEKFLSVVTSERKLDPQNARTLADGRIYSGKQAVENKLIDAIGYFEDAITAAENLAQIKEPRVIRYTAPYDLRRLLRSLSQVISQGLSLRLPQAQPLLPPLRPGALYYLPPHLLLTP
ncbi:MAG: signal peptide peptidase SppA [Methylacidiphilales bacterium]|nr:signal peptide peptidase SppA [Candidatus Methylacidiphilales bacterium]MDW8348702.1 signal peptide peptidase SppA [Verrucomicrobiae bacterium]